MRKVFILALGLLLLSIPLVAHIENQGNQAEMAFAGSSGKEMLDDAENSLDVELRDADKVRELREDGVGKVLQFDSMIPISGAFVGTDLLAGVPGGGLPWVIESARGSLDAAGRLKITVTGLVLAGSGVNPQPAFQGLVSCTGEDGGIQNFSTADFPTDVEGNAEIDETLTIIGPCFAPIIFVTGPAGQWFAVTGSVFGAAATPTPVVSPPAG